MHYDRMMAEIEVAHRLGVDVFVIDTGWYIKTGDWLVNLEKLPRWPAGGPAQAGWLRDEAGAVVQPDRGGFDLAYLHRAPRIGDDLGRQAALAGTDLGDGGEHRHVPGLGIRR